MSRKRARVAQRKVGALGAASLALGGLFACTVPERPKYEVLKAEVAMAAALSEDATSLRYAVLWAQQGNPRPIVSDDGAVRSTEFDVELRLPASVNVDDLVPIESVEVARDDGLRRTPGGNVPPPASVVAQAYRPRIAVYDDRDGDDRLDLRPSAEDSIDRVLAVDGGLGFARILDADEMFRSMTLLQAERFYERNPDFNGFVFASAGGTLQMAAVGVTFLTGTFHQHNRQDLLCQRQVSNTSTSRTPLVRVAAGVDLDTICEAWVGECVRSSLSEGPLIESTPEVARTPQCKRNSQYESLIVFTAESECAECSCNAETRVEAYVARRTQLPEWWPCGDEVAYCTQPGSLVFYSTLCPEVLDAGAPVAPNDGGLQSGVDATVDAGTESDASTTGF